MKNLIKKAFSVIGKLLLAPFPSGSALQDDAYLTPERCFIEFNPWFYSSMYYFGS